MKFNAALTKEQAKEMFAYLEDIFTEVKILDIEAVRRLEKDKNSISLKAFRERCQKKRLEYVESRVYQRIARYVEIEGEPYVVEMLNVLGDAADSEANAREALVAKVRGYNEELYLDALTGAYNRRYYEDRIRKVKSHAGVAMIDLDDFKLWNDTYGHGAGDVVLQTVVKAIRQSTRKTDSLVRYGGDEFLLVMPDVSDEVFLKKLEYIQKQIRDADIPGFSRMRLSVSIGGVTVREEVMEEAVRKADRLMYQAKIQKNMVVTERKSIDADGMIHLEEEIKRTKQLIMIVDDSEINREILASILEEDYQIIEAENGEDCLRLLQKYGTEISLILLDIVMPGMNGFQVLHDMNKNHWIEDVPVIMISSEDSEKSIRRAYEMGVSDYISRPFDGKIVYQRVFNTIKLYAKQRRLITLVTDQVYEKEKNNRIMVSILSQIVEFRNGESGLHVEHINKLSGMLLERLVQKTDKYHLTWTDQYLITVASALHDIGKIGIDEKILNKPGKLTPEEFELMKMHTMIGASMLKRLEIYKEERLVQIACEICRWHHERYDGSGYPDGLKGEEIPIAAQVVSIVDVYDALTSPRVYKKAYSHEKAMQMILTGECGVFQPLLLDCFCDIQEEIRKVTQEKSEKEGKISGFELTDLKETLKNSHLIGDLKPEKNH